MHIWDTAGSDRFRNLVQMYYRDAIAAVVCYDVTNIKSFDAVSYWVNEMQQKNNMEHFCIAVAGNKCDSEQEEWEISESAAREKLTELKLGPDLIFEQTSAKTGENIADMFAQIAESVVKIKLKE